MDRAKNSTPIRVLVVDDHAVVREGICALLSRRKDLEIVGQAADGRQAVDQVAAHQPDVVLMDIAMPEMNGLDATREITKTFPDTRVLVLTQYENKEYAVPLLRAGAAGYILKRARVNELVDAIRAVHHDGVYLPTQLAHTIVAALADTIGDAAKPIALTEREREVVRWIAEGLSSREIADRLCISAKTVDTHRANIMEKLDIHNTAELIRYAIREGIVNA